MQNLTFALVVFLGGAQLATAAETYSIPANTSSLSLIEPELVSVTTEMPKCPSGAICEPASVALLRFTLPSCVDQLGPVSIIQGPRADGAGVRLNVTAFAAINPNSTKVKCFAPAFADVKVFLGFGFASKDSVEIRAANNLYNP